MVEGASQPSQLNVSDIDGEQACEAIFQNRDFAIRPLIETLGRPARQ